MSENIAESFKAECIKRLTDKLTVVKSFTNKIELTHGTTLETKNQWLGWRSSETSIQIKLETGFSDVAKPRTYTWDLQKKPEYLNNKAFDKWISKIAKTAKEMDVKSGDARKANLIAQTHLKLMKSRQRGLEKQIPKIDDARWQWANGEHGRLYLTNLHYKDAIKIIEGLKDKD